MASSGPALSMELALARPPSEEERRLCVERLKHSGLSRVCHVLLNTSEFLFNH